MKEPKIPELTCEGCKARDAMIQRLSERVDELERSLDRVSEELVIAAKNDYRRFRSADWGWTKDVAEQTMKPRLTSLEDKSERLELIEQLEILKYGF